MIEQKDPQTLIYLDETGIDDNEVYPYAWGPKGSRVYGMKQAERNRRLSIRVLCTIKRSRPLSFLKVLVPEMCLRFTSKRY